MERSIFGLTGFLLAALVTASAQPPSDRHAISLDPTYEGPHQAARDRALDRLHILTRQAPLEVSMAAGLYEYQEGFRYPLRIRFADQGPPGLENALAYVALGRNSQSFAQEMVIVLEPMARAQTLPAWADFETIVAHEMTHAVLNDSVGGDASLKIPRWLQEGLAQWVSKEGEPRLKDVGAKFRKTQIRQAPLGLDRPPIELAYPLYYLAVRYIDEKHTINAVQGLVRNLIDGQPIDKAICENTQLPYDEFRKRVETYSRDALVGLARSDFGLEGAGL